VKIFDEILRKSFIYTISNISLAAIPFFLLPILTRYLSPEEYGHIAMFNLLIAIFIIFISLNSQSAIMVNFFRRDEFNISNYIGNALILVIISIICTFILVFSFKNYISYYSNLSYSFVLLAFFAAIFNTVIQIFLSVLQSEKKALIYSAVKFLQALIDASLSLVLIIVFLLSFQGRLYGVSISFLIIGIMGIIYLIKNRYINLTLNLKYQIDLLKYGFPLIPHAIGGIIISMIDRILITNLIDIYNTGIYMVAVQIGLIFAVFVDAINKAYAPWMMEHLVDIKFKEKKIIVLYSYIYFLILILLATLGSIFSYPIIRLMAGDEYIVAAPLIKYIFFGNAFLGMYFIVTNYIFYAKKTSYLSWIMGSNGIFTVLLMYYFISNEGIIGAAKSYMISQFLMFIFTWALASKSFDMPWRKVFLK
jgi:O-antigen/teichoic acid export membrane protein